MENIPSPVTRLLLLVVVRLDLSRLRPRPVSLFSLFVRRSGGRTLTASFESPRCNSVPAYVDMRRSESSDSVLLLALLSALHEIHREPAQARLLVFRLHLGAGLAHRGDHAVERDEVAPVPMPRHQARPPRSSASPLVGRGVWAPSTPITGNR
jgi:hypothetical protein